MKALAFIFLMAFGYLQGAHAQVQDTVKAGIIKAAGAVSFKNTFYAQFLSFIKYPAPKGGGKRNPMEEKVLVLMAFLKAVLEMAVSCGTRYVLKEIVKFIMRQMENWRKRP